MGKILSIVLLFSVSACSHFKGDEEVVPPIAKVEMIPLAKPLIAKPRLNVNSKEYTAPYPQHIVATAQPQMPAVAAGGTCS